MNYHVLGTGEELPTPSETYKGIVYLKKNTESEAGEYIEHLCVNNGTEWKWEQIGSTKTDLTDYAKKTDLEGYAKSIKINGVSKPVTTNTTEINLGSVVKGFYATDAQGGVVAPNADSIRVFIPNTNDGIVDIGVIDATETDKGLVTLSSVVDASNTGAVTGAGVASAISGLASDADVVKTIKMNGSTTPLTPADGQIDLGTVVTGFDVDSYVGQGG